VFDTERWVQFTKLARKWAASEQSPSDSPNRSVEFRLTSNLT